jgi:hypothetical protein
VARLLKTGSDKDHRVGRDCSSKGPADSSVEGGFVVRIRTTTAPWNRSEGVPVEERLGMAGGRVLAVSNMGLEVGIHPTDFSDFDSSH